MKRHFNYFVAILVLCVCFLNTVHADQSPKELFEIIGNPQFDLREQGSAYETLKDKASGDPSIWRAGDTNSIEGALIDAKLVQVDAANDLSRFAG
jgi:cytolysin (calcineurin-like family phosphatase)